MRATFHGPERINQEKRLGALFGKLLDALLQLQNLQPIRAVTWLLTKSCFTPINPRFKTGVVREYIARWKKARQRVLAGQSWEASIH